MLLFGLAGLLFIMINIRTEPVHAAEAEDADSSSMQLDLLSDLPLSDIQDVLKQNTDTENLSFRELVKSLMQADETMKKQKL